MSDLDAAQESSGKYVRWYATDPNRPKCILDFCESGRLHGDFCGAHYAQKRRGEVLRPVRGSKAYHQAKLNDKDEKQCTRCGYWLPLTDFYVRKDGSKVVLGRSHCNRCNILRRMGMTAKDYDERLTQQGGGCAICSKVENGSKGRIWLAVDHDHGCCSGSGSCGSCVRGLVCDGCNVMLGRAMDRADILRKGAEYLEAYESR
ncbi:endonuclease domain-containing protein [Paractinoplanes toevensis]|uniref:endonuclease domain-containing protein n=1 Tax=Paractinoplanes toevensis TaxID=571911 RepID=UPI001BB3A90F|nr:endonuclease domain-containing protein [Actinoplanes toevensis]